MDCRKDEQARQGNRLCASPHVIAQSQSSENGDLTDAIATERRLTLKDSTKVDHKQSIVFVASAPSW